MREILLRGKRKDNNEWVCSGSLIQTFDNGVKEFYIPKYGEAVYATYDIYTDHIAAINCDNDARFYNVDPSTVGQYTGLTDKNGTRIFEGDIVKSCEYDDVYFVKYFDNDNYSAFDCVPDVPLCECNGLSYLVNEEGCKVIGNIHDNPELLKGGVDNG